MDVLLFLVEHEEWFEAAPSRTTLPQFSFFGRKIAFGLRRQRPSGVCG